MCFSCYYMGFAAIFCMIIIHYGGYIIRWMYCIVVVFFSREMFYFGEIKWKKMVAITRYTRVFYYFDNISSRITSEIVFLYIYPKLKVRCCFSMHSLHSVKYELSVVCGQAMVLPSYHVWINYIPNGWQKLMEAWIRKKIITVTKVKHEYVSGIITTRSAKESVRSAEFPCVI
jgi:hypothetical protein